MAKKYNSPVILAGPIDDSRPSLTGDLQFIRDEKGDISTSFVYGDDFYEEEYVVPDVVEEVISSDTASEESGE